MGSRSGPARRSAATWALTSATNRGSGTSTASTGSATTGAGSNVTSTQRFVDGTPVLDQFGETDSDNVSNFLSGSAVYTLSQGATLAAEGVARHPVQRVRRPDVVRADPERPAAPLGPDDRERRRRRQRRHRARLPTPVRGRRRRRRGRQPGRRGRWARRVPGRVRRPARRRRDPGRPRAGGRDPVHPEHQRRARPVHRQQHRPGRRPPDHVPGPRPDQRRGLAPGRLHAARRRGQARGRDQTQRRVGVERQRGRHRVRHGQPDARPEPDQRVHLRPPDRRGLPPGRPRLRQGPAPGRAPRRVRQAGVQPLDGGPGGLPPGARPRRHQPGLREPVPERVRDLRHRAGVARQGQLQPPDRAAADVLPQPVPRPLRHHVRPRRDAEPPPGVHRLLRADAPVQVLRHAHAVLPPHHRRDLAARVHERPDGG